MEMRSLHRFRFVSLALLLTLAACEPKKQSTDGYHIPEGPPIVTAAAEGDLKKVVRLVSLGPNKTEPSPADLHKATEWAILNSRPEVAKFLVKRGVPIDPTPDLPFGLLFSCVGRYTPESTEILEWLLKRGANPNVEYRKEGWIPFNMAVNNGMIDKVRLLARYGANLNDLDRTGQTPMEMMKSRLERYQDPRFDLPHGEMRDPKYRAATVAKVQEMISVLEELGAK